MKKIKILSLIMALCIIVAGAVSLNVISVDASAVIRNNANGIPCRYLYRAVLRAVHGNRTTRTTFTRAQAARVTTLRVEYLRRHGTKSLRGIHHLTSLRGFSISNYTNGTVVRVTNAEIRRLERLPRLRNLSIFGVRNIRNLRGFRNLRNLRVLSVQNGRLTTTCGIENLRNLQRVNFRGNSLANLRGAERLRNLRRLDAGNNRLTNLNELRNLRNLTHILADGNRLTNISGLRNSSNLVLLRVSRNRLQNISVTRHLTNLRVIDVMQNRLTVIPDLTRHRRLEVRRERTRYGDFIQSFAFNQIPARQLRTRLPAQMHRHSDGNWLLDQISLQGNVKRSITIENPASWNQIFADATTISGITNRYVNVRIASDRPIVISGRRRNSHIFATVRADANGRFEFMDLNFEQVQFISGASLRITAFTNGGYSLFSRLFTVRNADVVS